MITEEKLKPCPFCGKPVTLESTQGGELFIHHSEGRGCRVMVTVCTWHRQVAIAEWNTRVETKEEGEK